MLNMKFFKDFDYITDTPTVIKKIVIQKPTFKSEIFKISFIIGIVVLLTWGILFVVDMSAKDKCVSIVDGFATSSDKCVNVIDKTI